MELDALLKELSEMGAVTGDEFALAKRLGDIFKPMGHEILIDNVGNTLIHVKGENSDRKAMIFTHIDEPGLVVKSFGKEGFLDFDIVGPIKPKDLASQEVYVWGEKPILGLTGLRPPHILSREESKAPVTMEEMSIDTGFSSEDISKHVSIGTTATIKRNYKILRNDRVCAKALKDRVGVAILYEVLSKLNKPSMDLYIVFGVQQYNGHKGAKVALSKIKPDLAIILDGDKAKSREDIYEKVELSKGPAIYKGPTSHPLLTKWLIDFAKTKGNTYQIKAASGKNPTAAWAIQIGCGGTPTAVILNPVKYPASSVEVVDKKDILETAKLLTGFIKHIGQKEWRELLCF